MNKSDRNLELQGGLKIPEQMHSIAPSPREFLIKNKLVPDFNQEKSRISRNYDSVEKYPHIDQSSNVQNSKVRENKNIQLKTHKLAQVLSNLRFKEKIDKLKECSQHYRFRNLAEQDYQLIGDQAHVPKRDLMNKEIVSGRIYKHLKDDSFKKFFIIDPDGFLNNFISLIIGITGFINFLLFPLELSFPGFCFRQGCTSQPAIQIFTLMVYLLKAICGIFTSYQKQNILVENFPTIFQNYIKTELFFDLLPIVQSAININRVQPLLGLIYLFQIHESAKLVENFCIYFHIEEKFIACYQVTRLVLIILSVAHYNCLIFYTISQTGGSQNTWIETEHLLYSEWSQIYERALYFMIISMLTVGYGDITPVTSRERITIIFITLFSCFIFGYAVNTVGSIFQQRDLKSRELKQEKKLNQSLLIEFILIFIFPSPVWCDIQIFPGIFRCRRKQFRISNYLHNRGVSIDINRKVLREIEYISQMEKDGLFDDSIDKILEQVSIDLKQEVQTNISFKILRNCQLLNNTMSLQSLEEFSKYMKERTLIPGEVLFKRGESENRIYYINNGEMQMFLENSDRESEIILHRIPEKSYVGEISFLSPNPYEESVRSVGVTHVIFFQYEDLQKVLINNPADFEKVNMKKDKIQFSIRSIQQEQRCFVCKGRGHKMTHCPRIVPQFDQEMIMKKHNSKCTVRNRDITIIRQAQKCRFSTFDDNDKIRKQLIRFRKDLISLILENNDDRKLQSLEKLDFQNLTDYQFYFQVPQVIVNQKQFVIEEDDHSFLEFSEGTDHNQMMIENLDSVLRPNEFNIDDDYPQSLAYSKGRDQNKLGSNFEFDDLDDQNLSNIVMDGQSWMISEENQVNKINSLDVHFNLKNAQILEKQQIPNQNFREEDHKVLYKALTRINSNQQLENEQQIVMQSSNSGKLMALSNLRVEDENFNPVNKGMIKSDSQNHPSTSTKQDETPQEFSNFNQIGDPDDVKGIIEFELDCLREYYFYFSEHNFSNLILNNNEMLSAIKKKTIKKKKHSISKSIHLLQNSIHNIKRATEFAISHSPVQLKNNSLSLIKQDMMNE